MYISWVKKHVKNWQLTSAELVYETALIISKKKKKKNERKKKKEGYYESSSLSIFTQIVGQLTN